MMRPVYLRLFTIVAVLAFLAGCSSDSGTDTSMKQGNPNDYEFLQMSENVDQLLDSLVDNTVSPLMNPWGFAIDTTNEWKDRLPVNPDDSVVYEYDDQAGWYSLYVGNVAASGSYSMIDSVMFLYNGQPTPYYTWGTTGIDNRVHIQSTVQGGNGGHLNTNSYFKDFYSGVNETKATVNGVGQIDVETLDILGDVQTLTVFDADVTITDVQFERADLTLKWNMSTLTGGTINLQITSNTSVTQNNTTTNNSRSWSFNVVIGSDGVASIEAISENTRWTYTLDLNF